MYKLYGLWRAIKRSVVNALNLDIMSEKYHVLVENYVLLMIYTTLESVFVNTLLYTVLDDISIVIYYRGVTYLACAIMMHPAAYFAKKRSPIMVMKTGAVLYMVTYLLLFFGLTHMNILMIPIAIMSGSASAFYWSGHMQLIPYYTTRGNRDTGLAILGIVQGIVTLAMPVVSGFVISAMPGNTGYRVMFGVGMLAVAGQILIQRRLAPVEQKMRESQTKLALKLLWEKLTFKLMVGYEIMRGFRDGAFAFILNMLLFEIITDESLVGINTFLTGAASIVGSWVYGKVVRPRKRGRISILAALILTLACLPLYALMNVFTLMSFNVISAFVTLFIVNSCAGTAYDMMGQNETTRKCVGEMAAIRENALVFGRISGLAVLMLLPHDQHGYVNSILVLTLSQFLCGVLIMLSERALNRSEADEMSSSDGEPA